MNLKLFANNQFLPSPGRKATLFASIADFKTVFENITKHLLGTDFEEYEENNTIDWNEINCVSGLLNISKIYNDIASKIEDFDFENISTNSNFNNGSAPVGINEIILKDDRKFQFIGCSAGGDGQTPVFFILYISDNNTIRAYVPVCGNVYDRLGKIMFSDDPIMQIHAINRKYGTSYVYDNTNGRYDNFETDSIWLLKDITSRITY